MKKLALLTTLILISTSSLAKADTYDCYPETANSDQTVVLKVDFKNNKAGLKLGNRGVYGCSKVNFKSIGDVRDYGEAALTFKCRGERVTFVRNYDEEVLDLSVKLQKVLKLDDSTYMCE